MFTECQQLCHLCLFLFLLRSVCRNIWKTFFIKSCEPWKSNIWAVKHPSGLPKQGSWAKSCENNKLLVLGEQLWSVEIMLLRCLWRPKWRIYISWGILDQGGGTGFRRLCATVKPHSSSSARLQYSSYGKWAVLSLYLTWGHGKKVDNEFLEQGIRHNE